MTKKWEATRGIGHSFGANRNERPEDIVSATDLIRSFVDIVSKNGNLLIGIGPRPDGTVPEEQRVPLRGLGEWMSVNGGAIIGSRPWDVAQSTTSEGTPVRFTERQGVVYAFLLGLPGSATFSLPQIDGSRVPEVRLLGLDQALASGTSDRGLRITLPERVGVSAVHVLHLGTGARPVPERP